MINGLFVSSSTAYLTHVHHPRRLYQNIMIRVPGVAIILENSQNEILLLLRDDKPTILHPNHWSLPGGKVEFLEKIWQAASAFYC